MQTKYNVFSMQNSDPTLHTPQEKLRKISFDASQLDQFPVVIKNNQKQMKVDGWGNENWDFKTQGILNKPKSKNSNTRPENYDHSLKTVKKQPKFLQQQTTNNRSKYIEKLEQKLVQLVEMKEKNSKIFDLKNGKIQNSNYLTNGFVPHYISPQKITNQKTSSTSESQFENKCEHNFTSTMYQKYKEKQRSFSIKRKSRNFSQNQSITNQNDDLIINQIVQSSIQQPTKNKYFQPYSQRNNTQYEKRSNNRSMLDSYENLIKKSQQISLISYPVIDQERLSRRAPKLSKLNEFYEKFQSRNSKNSSQRSKHQSLSKSKKLKFNLSEEQQSLFRIKITQPCQNNKKKTFKILLK